MIRITAEDSPNVVRAMRMIAAGLEPDGEVVLPGVITWDEYLNRRKNWRPEEQRVSLDALFPDDATTYLFPSGYLDHCFACWERLRGRPRKARAVGCDPAEGGDDTAFSAVDEYGLVDMMTLKTPDTNVIPGMLIAFGKRHGVPPENWAIDRGNGKQHADRLRAMGYMVRTVGFGSKVILEPRRGLRLMEEKRRQREEGYAYKNRRAQMFGELSLLCQPNRPRMMHNVVLGGDGFALPPPAHGPQYAELVRQLRKIPYRTDDEGCLRLPPKGGGQKRERSEKTLMELLGCSPDEADSLVLAVHAMLHKSQRRSAGAVV